MTRGAQSFRAFVIKNFFDLLKIRFGREENNRYLCKSYNKVVNY